MATMPNGSRASTRPRLRNLLVAYTVSSFLEKIMNFDLIALPDAEGGIYKIPIEITYTDEAGTSYTKDDYISLKLSSTPDLLIHVDSSEINADMKSGTVVLKIINRGLTNIKLLTAELDEGEGYEIMSQPEVYVGNIDSDDYETVDGSFPTTFTFWGGSAYDLYVDSHAGLDLRINDYVTGTGIQSGSKITKITDSVITIDKPTTQPFTNETFTFWGGLDVFRNFDYGQITIRDEVRTGKEFHPLVPSITEIKSQDEVNTVSISSIVIEPDALHHYENSAGEWLDAVYPVNIVDGVDIAPPPYPDGGTINISAPSGAIISNYDYVKASNEAASKIRIIKPSLIARLTSEFQRLVKG